jgi:hypothetical protein
VINGEIHKLLIFLKRKAGTSIEEFGAYYEQQHIPQCLPYMAGPVRYRRYYLDSAENMPEPEFDVMTELWFGDSAMRDMVISGLAADRLPADVIADEVKFLDRSKSRFYAVTKCETPLESARS